MEATERPVPARMLELQQDHFGGPIARSWSADFVQEPYLDRPDLILDDALAAITATRVTDGRYGPYLNLLLPTALGDPAAYLIPALQKELGDAIYGQVVGEQGSSRFLVRLWRYR